MSLSQSIKYELNYGNRCNNWLCGFVVVAVFGDAENDSGDWPYKLGGILAWGARFF